MSFRWDRFVFLRLTLYLIGGILWYIHTQLEIPFALGILIGLAIAFIAFRGLAPKPMLRKSLLPTGLAIMLFTFLVGYQLAWEHTESNQPTHLLHQKDTVLSYEGVISWEVTEKAATYGALLEIRQVKTRSGWQKASGQVMAYISKADSGYVPLYGDVLLVHGAPQLLEPPQNPQEFDYRRYLGFHQVHHRQFLALGRFLKTGTEPPNQLFLWSFQARDYLNQAFQKYIPGDQERTIALALVAGIKDGLDNEVKTAYSSAGAMHVLAVSGLHVGIIVQVLMLVFGPLRKSRRGKWVYVVIAILSLWIYAFITGLSASVLRAVTMFSFLTLALGFSRKSEIYNTLAVSAFVLLCFNPYIIMEVGFQLSYAAVFGIVFLQPRLYRLFTVPTRAGDWAWKITCVSIAAQIATFPIGLLYFHQFPSYFLVSNLFVIPAALIIVWAGLGLVITSLVWEPLAIAVGWLLSKGISLLNYAVFFIEKLPNSLITGFHISIMETWFVYGLILGISMMLIYRSLKWGYLGLVAAILIFGIQALENHQLSGQRFFTVYQINRQTNLGFIQGQQAFVLGDSSLIADTETLRFHTFQHLWSQGISDGDFLPFEEINDIPLRQTETYTLALWQQKVILILKKPIDGLPFPVDYLVLSKNGIRDFERVKDWPYQHLIIDGSNSNWLIERLAQQADVMKIPVHFTTQVGAFSVPLP